MNLYISLTGPDTITLFRSVCGLEPFTKKPPTLVWVDEFDEYEGTSDWIDRRASICEREVMAYWGYGYRGEYQEGFVHFHRFGIVKININDYSGDAQSVLAVLSPLPWTLAAFASIYDIWYAHDNKMYPGIGFGDFHYSHGWGCAFKGEGHRQLVSRRWLEYGPWHLLRGPNDVSLVQFHDLEADATTALEQAIPGHQRMGFSPTGGMVHSNYFSSQELRGLYSSFDRKYRVVVYGREVTQREMLDLCIIRSCQALGADKPIDSVAYVFIEEEQATEYLHELWLREIECWTIIDGSEVRLDTDYHPVPDKPDWVRHLEQASQI